jgi:glycerophosphoryl diester phosphodiesterase
MSLFAIAHRAGNSLSGLREAHQFGADVIECDVHAHRGRLEVRHLKASAPRATRLGLSQVLEADARTSRFMLDLKGRSLDAGSAVAALLHEAGHQDEVWACGRYWPAVEHLARLPWVRPIFSGRTRAGRALLERRLSSSTRPAPYGVSLHVSLLDQQFVQRLRERVEVVMTWPVNTMATLERVIDLGVNGIITDESAILGAVRDLN